MNGKSLVSVIIIFFNAEKLIEEAIEGVFAQTFANWELLLVDDGSVDAGSQIARKYADQYPGKVKYLDHNGHTNLGMSATRNHGIRNCNGQYVAFLDARRIGRCASRNVSAFAFKKLDDDRTPGVSVHQTNGINAVAKAWASL